MPYSPKSPCKVANCPNRADKWGYCREHYKEQEGKRKSSTERGYTWNWRKARKMFLNANPLCAECKREKKIVGATIVDHIIPHRGDPNLFHNQDNWQSLCKYHHDKKTLNEITKKN